jgi:type III restriction enzyme
VELKSYQRKAIKELSAYLAKLGQKGSLGAAYREHWLELGVKVGPGQDAMPPYQDTIKGVPHVCFKVPTGGGKTFMACAAVKPIADAVQAERPQIVVWLVPSNAILDQTIRNLSTPGHPYRQRLERDFNGRVAVYSKEPLLSGQNFSPAAVHGQLSVCILSYDSLRSNNKDGRLVYRQNSGLAEFVKMFTSPETLLEGIDETALIQVLNQLSPIVIVDESHNAQSSLSVEMLYNLNSAFILELTATPRGKSNIISLVEPVALKKENMVKLPVIAYNRNSQNDVIRDAILLRGQLEAQAQEHYKNGGQYIRPIVLFQAEPKGREDAATFTAIREKLKKIPIDARQIAVKTSEINELKNIDLLSKDCPIRYIITVNALKEGWDCPFAYILATLANKSSLVDVEQIVGRVLRLPYAQSYEQPLLNRSFVLTSANEFRHTLASIVAGLNNAGFSKKDVRVADLGEQESPEKKQPEQLTLGSSAVESVDESINPDEIGQQLAMATPEDNDLAFLPGVSAMVIEAEKQAEAYDDEISNTENSELPSGELVARMNCFPMRTEYSTYVKSLSIPQFFLKTNYNSYMLKSENLFLNKTALSKGFKLHKQDIVINFGLSQGDIYTVDISKSGDIPKYQKISESDKAYIKKYMSDIPHENQKEKWAVQIAFIIEKSRSMDVIDNRELQQYVARIVNEMDADTFSGIANSQEIYARKIQDKIETLLDLHRKCVFKKMLDAGTIICHENYTFPPYISPAETGDALENSLYDSEGNMNDFEHAVISTVSSLDNILFWHKVEERKPYSFLINGFINHYPDFLVMTKSGIVIALETKGGDRDNSDSMQKLSLGRAWASKAGDKYRYFMVFQKKDFRIDGSYILDEFMSIISQL